MIHRSQSQGLETLLIDTPLARCEVSLFGAQVLSFVPKHDGRDLLWCSAARLEPGRPIRGGIPVCWPWFARQGVGESAPQHGFVRTLPWSVDAIDDQAADGAVTVALVPDPAAFEALAEEVRQGWPLQCRPRLTLTIGEALTVELETVNGSNDTLRLTQALHTYFRVGDVAQVGIGGLQGLHYLDKLEGFAEFEQAKPWRFGGACDRIYLRASGLHDIDDPVLGRRIKVEATGSASTVVWNPGADGVLAFADIPPRDWFQYVCVEAANCEPLDGVTLEPGAKARITQRIAAG
jgi:glucose-6-phosphate 1-epimerase